MIKVFQVVECGGPGGTGEQVAAICGGLDPTRFDVSLVYAVRDGSPDEYRAKCSGAKTAYYLPELTREVSPAADATALRKLHRLFAEHRPDVVHTHSSKAGVLGRAAAKAAGVKRIFYSPHGYSFLMQDRTRAERALFRMIERGAARIGETIAVSPSEAQFARRLAPRRPVHVVCDAYLGDAPELLPHDDVVVGSCGRMTYARNPEAWVLLVQRLTDSRNGVRCEWIGGGENEDKARTDLTNMNLLMKVSITGWLTAEQARERLRGLDVFVHYSRWDALSNAVLEAMALGLPVVASDVPGNRDLVEDGVTGFLVKNEVELLERCQQLIDDEALRRKLGAAGRERMRREFSREHMIAELSKLYAR
ncbi:MAG TPA: glycosyltransferase [Elusimicrobiota bacterium]|nr:glycosyltransferase [Elusimicrobiota bacterium]